LSHAIDIAHQQEQAEPAQQDRVRFPVVLLSFAALAGSCVLATYLEFKTHSAHLAMSNLPLVVLIPFVVGLAINVLLKLSTVDSGCAPSSSHAMCVSFRIACFQR
jgi:hypothetical protein